jgi:sirohydrochlorin cobaltochelatase
MSDPKSALILFAHGARDARWSQTLVALARSVADRMPDAFVATAFLEFQPPTLAETLDRAIAAGCRRIAVLPVFWASGGHMASDVPPLLAAFRRAQPQVEIVLLPVLSELPGMIDFIADRAARLAGNSPE